MNEPLPHLLRRALGWAESGRDATACLVVNNRGSTPQTAGALMLVDDAARTWGTIGGGCVEAEVRRRAMELRADGASGVLSFKLDHDYGWDDGLICGGTLEVAVGPLPDPAILRRVLADIDGRRATLLTLIVDGDRGPEAFDLRVEPKPRLLIAGAGHVGQALARIAQTLEFDVTLFDDRADVLDHSRGSGAGLVTGDIAAGLRDARVDAATACVVVTRGHRHDEQALAALVGRGAGYVGMIGSRRKVKLIFDDLLERGVDPDALAGVHAPIGLDIGAETVEEIAVSIVAQLVAWRRAARVKLVAGPRPVVGSRTA